MLLRVMSLLLVAACGSAPSVLAQSSVKEARAILPAPFDVYFQRRVSELSRHDWQAEITAENWPAIQASMRRKLQRMLGLDPWPDRTALQPVITGTVQGDGYVIEKLHFQSLPGLYVTANLYRPPQVTAPLPAILYVCGHAKVIENGMSLGNKTGYQHHGIWFARHGYVCLVLDTIQLGEISGFHHGTNHLNRWWWAARGYTPAGVETWNGIRALDYLETRAEVARERIGMTGRSGGGAYCWWIAGLDDRVKVAVPVAGITSLKNHVLDGAIEGHCDCMFMVNTERWDFDRVAGLIAPRPLLISNTDKDEIFPLDGVMEIYRKTRQLYRKLGKEDHIGLHIAEGPHKDTQPLNIGAFEWLNRFLKGADRTEVIDEPAGKVRPPGELKVFAELPADEKVTTVDEFFVPGFTPATTAPSPAQWTEQRDRWMRALRTDCFRSWPDLTAKATVIKTAESTAQGLRLTECQFTSEEPFVLRLWLLHRDELQPQDLESVTLKVLDDEGWQRFRMLVAAEFPKVASGAEPDREAFAKERAELFGTKSATAYFCPRGTGLGSWQDLSDRKQIHLRRRLLLLGESLESGQVFDIYQAVAALRSLTGIATRLDLQGRGAMGANALYASLFIEQVRRLDLHDLPSSHRTGPIYLNILRHLDLPQAVALAAERAEVRRPIRD